MLTKPDTTARPRDYDRPPGEYTSRAAAAHRTGAVELAEALLATDWLLWLAAERPDQAPAIVGDVRRAVRDALHATRTTRTARCARKAVRK